MGIYFNPGNNSFTRAVKSSIYLDKTGLLEELNMLIGTEDNCIALSHARRFGKSQAAGMLDAYYSLGCDSEELFSNFEIAKQDDFEEHLNKYNVIHVDISSVADYHKEDLVEECIKRIYSDFHKQYGDSLDYSKDIHLVITDIFERIQIPFIIIIDEWDCVIRNASDQPELVHRYLQFLHSLFKSEESKSYLALAYITGILPIKKIEDESALNNFKEYSMIEADQLTRYFGFTQEEVNGLCEKYSLDEESIKGWYNGYLISGEHMYNPNSVCEAIRRKRLDSYWKNTSAFETINKFITLNFDGLKEDIISMLQDKEVRVNTSTFQNELVGIRTKDEALTALIHLGYLGYDANRKRAFIPNFEVKMAYQAALEVGEWTEVANTIRNCDELLDLTIEGEQERVAELIEEFHSTYTSMLQYNDENSLSCVLTMAYFTAPAYYTILREMPTGKGFADMVFIPRANAGNRPAMIVELKYDESADTAIRQIKERRYAGALKDYGANILMVGISYEKDSSNSNYKKHTCVIEKFRND